MSIGEYRQALQRARAALLSALVPEVATAATDTAALVENRVVSTGKRADGGRFSPYSDKKAPAYLYFGRSANQAGDAAVRARAKQRQGISYREFRQVNGRGTGFKNFQFTGEMWQGFGVVSVQQIRPAVFRITLGGKNERTRRLLEYHGRREGIDIDKPSDEEISMVSRALTDRVVSILKRNLQ